VGTGSNVINRATAELAAGDGAKQADILKRAQAIADAEGLKLRDATASLFRAQRLAGWTEAAGAGVVKLTEAGAKAWKSGKPSEASIVKTGVARLKALETAEAK